MTNYIKPIELYPPWISTQSVTELNIMLEKAYEETEFSRPVVSHIPNTKSTALYMDAKVSRVVSPSKDLTYTVSYKSMYTTQEIEITFNRVITNQDKVVVYFKKKPDKITTLHQPKYFEAEIIRHIQNQFIKGRQPSDKNNKK